MTAQSRRGLTLLELLVSLALLGVAMTSGYAALALVVDRRETQQARMRNQLVAGWSRDAIVGWLSTARTDPLRAGPSFRGRDDSLDGLANDDLSFLTEAQTPLRSRRTLVRLRVERDSLGDSTRLLAELRDPDGSAQFRVVLATGISELDIRYLLSVGGSAEWLTSWFSASQLPVAVEIRLRSSDSARAESLLQLPILAAIGPIR